jgi:hypothetical protein
MFATGCRRVLQVSPYVNILHQRVVVSGVWPQTLAIQPDLTWGGTNVSFVDGKVLGGAHCRTPRRLLVRPLTALPHAVAGQ